MYNKIRGALPYLNGKNRKIILEAKLKGQLRLTLPLLLNENQCVQSCAEVMLMKINKWIHGGFTFKQENKKICKEIMVPLPEKEILDSSAKFIHKPMTERKTKSIQKHIAIPNRTT